MSNRVAMSAPEAELDGAKPTLGRIGHTAALDVRLPDGHKAPGKLGDMS